MQNVAHHLQQEAIRILHAAADEADLYARSAFNRYYYATFLSVRETLSDVECSAAGQLKHSSIPEFLRGAIHRRISKIQKKAKKLGDTELERACYRARLENRKFAETLEKAYATRVVADYKPDTLVSFGSMRFALAGVSVNEAHGWDERAKLWSRLVKGVLRQINE